MGFVVSYKCRKPDPDKGKAMKELQPLKTKGDVMSVLGLVVFCCEFIRNMSGLTALIQKLMEKNVLFEWNTEQQKGSETLENRISDKPCLAFPEREWYYELHKDVSLNGIGAVLFQKDPSVRLLTIELVSKALSKAQKKQVISFLECCAIVLGLKKFKCYVHGVHVDIFIDHYGLQNMMKNNPTAQIQRWWWDIADHDFNTYYKKGKQTSQIP